MAIYIYTVIIISATIGVTNIRFLSWNLYPAVMKNVIKSYMEEETIKYGGGKVSIQ